MAQPDGIKAEYVSWVAGVPAGFALLPLLCGVAGVLGRQGRQARERMQMLEDKAGEARDDFVADRKTTVLNPDDRR